MGMGWVFRWCSVRITVHGRLCWCWGRWEYSRRNGQRTQLRSGKKGKMRMDKVLFPGVTSLSSSFLIRSFVRTWTWSVNVMESQEPVPSECVGGKWNHSDSLEMLWFVSLIPRLTSKSLREEIESKWDPLEEMSRNQAEKTWFTWMSLQTSVQGMSLQDSWERRGEFVMHLLMEWMDVECFAAEEVTKPLSRMLRRRWVTNEMILLRF